MHTYKITTVFAPDWQSMFKAVFGESAVCVASTVNEFNAVYSFDSPQTPADLGALVKVESINNPSP